MMLHTERATRGQQRAFVHYGDLLDDWTQPVFALGEDFDLAGVKTAMAVDIAEVHRFIDPSLRRVTATWDDIGVPDRLRELAEADLVLCEDTRHTRRLLERHGIRARLRSYHEHNEAGRTAEVLPRLPDGSAYLDVAVPDRPVGGSPEAKAQLEVYPSSG